MLNKCRFLDKTGRTGSTLQLVNGILLVSSFGLVRLLYGTYTVRAHILPGLSLAKISNGGPRHSLFNISVRCIPSGIRFL